LCSARSELLQEEIDRLLQQRANVSVVSSPLVRLAPSLIVFL
jgi:hypothetical protein